CARRWLHYGMDYW
nr:immunoglobulin heavy chain junction region [Mus musculus]